MRTCLFLCFSLVASLAAFALFFDSYQGRQFGHEARRDNRQLLKVGFVVPLSGPLAEFGEAIKNGVTLAKEHNPGAAELIRTLYEDSMYDSRHAVAGFERLRTVSGVRLFYVFGGPMSEVLAPIAEAKEALLFSTEYSSSLTRGRAYVVRFANTAADFGRLLASGLQKQGLNRLVTVKCENQYHNTLHEALADNLLAGQTLSLTANYLPGETDFRAVIGRLRELKFDALGLYLLPGMQNAFLRQLRDAGLRYRLFGTDTFETASENAGVEEVAAGALYINAEVNEDFAERYRARFGNTSQIVHAAHAYEFTLLLAQGAATAAEAGELHNLPAKLALSVPHQSALGGYSFSADPELGQHFSFPLTVKTVPAPAGRS